MGKFFTDTLYALSEAAIVPASEVFAVKGELWRVYKAGTAKSSNFALSLTVGSFRKSVFPAYVIPIIYVESQWSQFVCT